MAEKKHEEVATNAVANLMKPAASATERRSFSEAGAADRTESATRASTLSNAERGGAGSHQAKGKMTKMAAVGMAFQFMSRTAINKRNRFAEIVGAQNEFLRKFGLGSGVLAYADEGPTDTGWRGTLRTWTVNPASDLYYTWIAIVTLAVLYNAITIIIRAVFSDFQKNYFVVWCTMDYLCDFLYLADMAVKFRTGYLEQGLLVRDFKKLALNYIRGNSFKLDVISILPTDFGCFFGPRSIAFRMNRLFRLPRAFEFTERTEARTNWPNAFRIGCLVMYIVIIIHWNGCLYFAVSESIGLGSDSYVYNDSDPYDSLTRRYVFSFYWSTLSLTTIGETKPPVTDAEYVFNIVDYFVGVLIFASIVGNVGSMITNMNSARSEFQNRMDAVKQYMGFQKVGKELENRVIKWFDYLWSNKQSLSDDTILQTLPDKLRAEIAMHVHFDTLRKVRIFQDCEAGLLAEMVLKLRLQVFSPGDYICRKGDIGKEMYIVKQGRLHVVSDDGDTIFATLNEGAVFGELSILNIAGNKTGNRRTANVRSVGYSDLFALSKDDLWEALKEYPEARKLLIQKGRAILKKDNLLDENAPEECETLDEKTERLDTVVDNLHTRFARLMGEYTNTHRKLAERIKFLEKKLDKYKNSPGVAPQIRLPDGEIFDTIREMSRPATTHGAPLFAKSDRHPSSSDLKIPSPDGDEK